MLRVGLTGSLGSGKSTVAAFLRELGAEVIAADELGRSLMEPGQPVFSAIVDHFGSAVVAADGRLNRAKLAQIAFQGGRVEELNAIVHPAVIEAQWIWMDEVFRRNPAAIAVLESALLFEVERDARARGKKLSGLQDWRRYIDRIVVVTAHDELKIARYAARITPPGPRLKAVEDEARHRLALQIPDSEKASMADYVIENNGDIDQLRDRTTELWHKLQLENNSFQKNASLE
jgi:dephospho-CoA kinase